MIRVLIADDHQLVRQGLVTWLEETDDIQVVGEARDGQEAIELAQELHPDVILLDILMPRLDGIRTTRKLKSMGSPASILMISLLGDTQSVRESARSGACGYFLKGGKQEELIEAIHLVSQGTGYASPRVAPLFFSEQRR